MAKFGKAGAIYMLRQLVQDALITLQVTGSPAAAVIVAAIPLFLSRALKTP